MVRVGGGETDVNLPGLDHLAPIELGDFLIGRYEVTNQEFKRFVEGGGYRRQELWKHPFAAGGRDAAVDPGDGSLHRQDRPTRAGRRGRPASYPDGQANYPVDRRELVRGRRVCGVRRRRPADHLSLEPTRPYLGGAAIVPLSNFAGRGLAPVGQYQGVEPVRHLRHGRQRTGMVPQRGRLRARIILGGGWNDQPYPFNDAYAQDPFDRSPTNGFRLVNYLSDTSLAICRASRSSGLFRDFRKLRPVSDPVFAAYRQMYDYDPLPLNAVVERRVDERDWIREQIAFDAAYADERMAAYLYLPKHGTPPYQAIVFFPGLQRDPRAVVRSEISSWAFDFIIKSGRAVIHPIYKGTYERQDSLHSDYPDLSNFYKEHVIAWAKDMRRSIDYLDTRPDIDTAKVAYYGVSWGGYLAGSCRLSSRGSRRWCCSSRGSRTSRVSRRWSRSISCPESRSRC